MAFLDGPSRKRNQYVLLTILINFIIVFSVLEIIYAQSTMDLTLLESKLLNFMFIIPFFIAMYWHGPGYGICIGWVAAGCYFVFPANEGITSLHPLGLAVFICQVIIFTLWALYIVRVKRKITLLDVEISEKEKRILRAEDKSNNDILEVLLKVIDAKDSYTYQHSKRVAYYAKCLAISAGIPEETAERVYIAGMLHDIGKIGLNENILNKITALDENEKQEASRHPVIGARIAENLNCFKDVIPGIYYHHEVYDGSGYPEGLKGDEIPLPARILSIADAFDAMTSDRSYRIGMPVEDAVRRLLGNIGNQFDPDLIVTFIDLVRNKSIHVKTKD